MKVSTHTTRSGTGLAIATIIAIVATLAVNILSNFFPPGGLNIGQIANTILREVQIIPANYAFAIWGLIYLGLIAYGIYQWRASQPDNAPLQQVNVLLIVACLAQIVWVYLFTLRLFWLSVVAMLAILLPLIGAYLKLNNNSDRSSTKYKWMVKIPFSIYLAWISVATIVNVAAALYTSGWDGWGIAAPTWTAILIIVAAIIGVIVTLQRADVAFTGVLIWAFIAIALRQLDNPIIWLTALIAAIILAVLVGFGSMRHSLRGNSL